MKLTPWFSANVMPVRPGVYEVHSPDGTWYQRWDGKYWFVASSTPEGAASSKYATVLNINSWRGLAEPPKGWKK